MAFKKEIRNPKEEAENKISEMLGDIYIIKNVNRKATLKDIDKIEQQLYNLRYLLGYGSIKSIKKV